IIGRLQNVNGQYLITAKSVSGYVMNRLGNYNGLDTVAVNYTNSISGISSVQLSHGPETVFSIPVGGSIESDSFLCGLLKNDDAKARDFRISILSGPYDLQGDSCLILRSPIYLPEESGREAFWGFSSVVIDMRQFFTSAGIKRINDMGYSYQLWIQGKSDTIVYDGILGDFETPYRADFSLGNKDWILYVEPVEGWISREVMTICVAGSFLAAIILTLLEFLTGNIIRSNMLLKNQTRQLRLSEEKERKLRNIYEASIESVELFLWEVSLKDGSARLMDNPYTQKVSREYGIPKEIPNLIQFIRARCIPEDNKILDDIFSRVRQGDNSIDEVIHFNPGPGKPLRTARISYTVICDEYGKPVKCYGTAQDITADNAKRDGYNQERIFFVSFRGKEMTNRLRIDLTTDEILASPASMPELKETSYTKQLNESPEKDVIIEDGRTAGELMNRNQLLQQYSMGIRSFVFEYQTGKIGSTRSWIRTVIKLFESPDNKHVEMFLYDYDISEQKNEQLLIGRIINSIYEKIGVIDLPDGTFRNFMVNKEIVSDSGMSYDGYMQATVAGRYIPETEQAIFREAMRLDTVKKELAAHDLYTFTTPYLETGVEDGSTLKRYKMIRFCYLDERRSIIIVCISDVTRQNEKDMEQKEELRNALIKAESANRAKSEFVSRISHDIRTPIGAIQNLTQFAKKDADDREKLLHDLDQIETSNKFLLSLINDVLDISKVDKGQIKLTPEIYPYEEFIDSIRNIIEPMCQTKGLHWQLNSVQGGYGGAAVIDRIRINQIALNILSNAVKYTPECGDVSYTSRSRRSDDGRFILAFEIKDTGIGMSEEFQKHMFEEFSQEYENSQRPKGITGTGLGLAIVKRMVDLMGGTLAVESQIGLGTTVNVEIPCQFMTTEEIQQSQEKDLELERQNENARVNLAGKVLLAEDNPINTDIAMTILDIFDCKVDHAENGKEAVELFAYSKPNEYAVILMDIQMPFTDGYEATRRIRALKRDDAKSVPIIAMTADAFEDA
ncbi:MAG: response regulator, partial [Treponema sp.]|nr:response regulator [Treponema sp.]